jgi:hypothetical protein
VSLTLHGPEPTPWHGMLRMVRVEFDDEDGLEEFEEVGEVQPFEQPEQYLVSRTRDRFTPELLDQYCRALGIRYLDPDFYGPHAVLLEAAHPPKLTPRGGIVSLSLAEAQRQLDILPDKQGE